VDQQSDDRAEADDRGTKRAMRRTMALAAAAGVGGLMLVCAGTYSLGYGVQTAAYPPTGSSGTEGQLLTSLLGFLILSVVGGTLVARVSSGGWVRAVAASVGGLFCGICLALLASSSVITEESAVPFTETTSSVMPWITTTAIFVVSLIVVIATLLGQSAGCVGETKATAVAAAVLCLSTPLVALNVAIAVPVAVAAWVLMPVVAVLASSNSDLRGL
jgi:hypothetical protein